MTLISRAMWEEDYELSKEIRKPADPRVWVLPERRREITLAMADPKNRDRKHTATTYIRKVCRRNGLTDFLDNATRAEWEHIEGLLGL
jgi:hypothetical protein